MDVYVKVDGVDGKVRPWRQEWDWRSLTPEETAEHLRRIADHLHPESSPGR